MTRRDGRPLVTEFPLTAEDWIDVVLDGEVPEGAVVCRRPSASRGRTSASTRASGTPDPRPVTVVHEVASLYVYSTN